MIRARRPIAVFDGRYIRDRYHGIGRYAFHLLAELAKAFPSVQFDVLRDPGPPDSRFDWSVLAASPNIHVREVSAPLFSLKEQAILPQILSASEVQLYHSPYFALPWLQPCPALVTVHDCIFEHDSRYMPKPWARLYYRLLVHYSVRRARAVLVPSEATAKDVRHFYGVPKNKLVVTPEAAAESFTKVRDQAALDEVRGRYDLHKPFVLAVGARRPHKNFAMLVKAFTRLQRSDADLVFVGEADERFLDDARVLAGDSNTRVRFMGKVPEQDLPLIYNLATAYVCPSLIEGFGLPVLEAMSCGTPVICSDIPVMREVAFDAALYAPPKDIAAWAKAIGRILDDPSLGASLSDKGEKRASQFTWARTAQAVVPLYRHVLLRNTT